MKKETYQDHHVIPISLLGHDWQENIIRVTESEHKLIHKTLNLPYHKIRKFRTKTNHMVHRNSQVFVKELRKIHLAFFQNIHRLPMRLKNLIRDSVREQTEKVIRSHNIELKTPKYNADSFSWLRSYHHALVLR